MGTLFYGDHRLPIEVEDRALAHLQLVILAKLRRGEAFSCTWHKMEPDADAQSTIWLHPAIPLNFDYEQPRIPPISRAWINQLAEAANANAGLALYPEPENPERPR
jgi:hypothetical protein